MFDVITFGSATSDTFLRLRKDGYKIFKQQRGSKGQSLCVPLGAKIFIEEMQVESGGGGTNAACTFAAQGFETAFCGKIGKDKAGEMVIEDLKEYGADISLCRKDAGHQTAFSAILSVRGQERTVLIYQGACHFMGIDDVPFKRIKRAKWFYIAPLSGQSAHIFDPIVRFAKDNHIRVAANLSTAQIELGSKVLRSILNEIDVLILNREEASLLANISTRDEKMLFRAMRAISSGINIITRGSDGSSVSAGKFVFEAGVPSVVSVEKTGAGDAYGSGFVAGLLEKNEIEYAMQFATANASGCIQRVGAKRGLLKKGEWGNWPKVKIKKTILKL